MMSGPVELFQNRMGAANWGFMALAFVLAAVLLLFQGAGLWLTLLICGGLAVAAIGFALVLITILGRRNIAALTLDGSALRAEMLSPFGNGRIVDIPLAETSDWRRTRTWPSVRFRHDGREFVLPLHGARVDWPALLAAAPGMRETLR
jgi:hypothetical protein